MSKEVAPNFSAADVAKIKKFSRSKQVQRFIEVAMLITVCTNWFLGIMKQTKLTINFLFNYHLTFKNSILCLCYFQYIFLSINKRNGHWSILGQPELCLLCKCWRHRRHVVVPLTKDFSLASIFWYTKMAAMSLSFLFP
jgi:hypothetical protein